MSNDETTTTTTIAATATHFLGSYWKPWIALQIIERFFAVASRNNWALGVNYQAENCDKRVCVCVCVCAHVCVTPPPCADEPQWRRLKPGGRQKLIRGSWKKKQKKTIPLFCHAQSISHVPLVRRAARTSESHYTLISSQLEQRRRVKRLDRTLTTPVSPNNELNK